MSFSGVIKISEIDDFIGPGNECTKPDLVEKGKVGISRNKVDPYKGSKGVSLEKVKITLEDCLACSGCVTSAETVLITQQSVEEFKNALKSKKVVVTVSQQSNLSLAHRYSLKPLESFRFIRGILTDLGVWVTRDLTPFHDLSLHETQKEFNALWSEEKRRTLLCSSCPGFVCYAEKTHGELLVPKLSKVRSPQQISGISLKESYPDVYHVTVMPCFDKKLEAARSEFEIERAGIKVRDVDCVLATVEIEKLAEEKLKENPMEYYIEKGTINEEDYLYAHSSGDSGGYLEYIFRQASKEKFNVDVPPGPLEFQMVRKNKDFQETTLTVDGEVKLRFAKAYGFRSIQNLVARMKQRKNILYDYVEVMACPSGCLNGGGQIRYEDREENKVILKSMIDVFNSQTIEEPLKCSKHSPLYEALTQIDKSFIYTNYRIIPKSTNPLTSNW